MNDATRKSLGGMVLGVVALVVGLLLRSSPNADVASVGQLVLIGGALLLVIGGVQLAMNLMRSSSD